MIGHTEMRRSSKTLHLMTLLIFPALAITACKSKVEVGDAGAPPSTNVVATGDMSLVSVDKPGQFPLVSSYLTAAGQLNLAVGREVLQ
jgi:hypothetical protein